jgi:hypothetical protein
MVGPRYHAQQTKTKTQKMQINKIIAPALVIASLLIVAGCASQGQRIWVEGNEQVMHYNPPRYSVTGTGEVGPMGLREELLKMQTPGHWETIPNNK